MSYPKPVVVVELLKPITWFPPMWAFACGVVSSGAPVAPNWQAIAVGILICGPLVCGASQAVNDWFDRHVDAINEPLRPIPSGRMPGSWGLGIAIGWSLLSAVVAMSLGPWGFAATVLGLVLAWAYSAPPLRLKQNGWWGNAACSFSYEGLAWFTGAAVMLGGALPSTQSIILAVLYSIGAHGIMTLNDFKSVEGDRRTGIGSLPVRLGVERAAQVACVIMAGSQLVVAAMLWSWGRHTHTVVVLALVAAQLWLMGRLLKDPRANAPWYNGTGIVLFVLGMLVSAIAVRGLERSMI